MAPFFFLGLLCFCGPLFFFWVAFFPWVALFSWLAFFSWVALFSWVAFFYWVALFSWSFYGRCDFTERGGAPCECYFLYLLSKEWFSCWLCCPICIIWYYTNMTYSSSSSCSSSLELRPGVIFASVSLRCCKRILKMFEAHHRVRLGAGYVSDWERVMVTIFFSPLVELKKKTGAGRVGEVLP